MKITPEEVIHVANLARLDLDEAVVEKVSHQMGAILEYIDKLNEVDTSHVQPTTHAIFLTNAFRDDLVHEHLERNQALCNAPQRDETCFLVPRIIG
jgi:aspartyl-tRNA(Asn)/glutamyl-tRNA(Gln) amidotransferase subunit C